MTRYPLRQLAGHLCLQLAEGTFVVDTGSPMSLGSVTRLMLDGRRYTMTRHATLPARLSTWLGAPVDGLIGTDILHTVDLVWDLPRHTLAVSRPGRGRLTGTTVPLQLPADVPVVPVTISGQPRAMVLDTGAWLSYYAGREAFPISGEVRDFHPTLGWFATPTRRVPLTLGGDAHTLTCGELPPSLVSYLPHETVGILGHEVFAGRRVGYFPARGQLVLGEAA